MRKLPDVNSKYGAPMGRAEIRLTGKVGNVRFHIQVMPLNSGGYDKGGAYWGLRLPRPYTYPSGHTVQRSMRLYWAFVTSTDGKRVLIQEFIEAWDRQDVKDQIRDLYPEARFYR